MNASSNEAARWDVDDLEPRIAHVLARTRARRAHGPYHARSDGEVRALLERYFTALGCADVVVEGLARMTGGASKEQFVFTLAHRDAPVGERLVLRMDPLQGIVETCRGREAQALRALAATVPVTPVRYVDADGALLGQPGVITAFVPGVTRPTDLAGQSVSGIGTRFDAWAARLAPQFIDNLARIHRFDWRDADLPDFTAPAAGTAEAALRQVNWWAAVWRQDEVEALPLIALAERWLRERAPICDAPVLLHADYRIGNFMFEEPSGRFTAVLDWELAHIGDFHEDLAWTMQRMFVTWRDDGTPLVSGLLPREDFLAGYCSATGFAIDARTLAWYGVLNAYKCAGINLASGTRAATDGNSHQDLLLSWLIACGNIFTAEIARLIEEYETL